MSEELKKQLEGPNLLSFKIILKDTLNHYALSIQEVETGNETILKITSNFTVAMSWYRNYTQNILKSGYYRLTEAISGPKRSQSLLFVVAPNFERNIKGGML